MDLLLFSSIEYQLLIDLLWGDSSNREFQCTIMMNKAFVMHLVSKFLVLVSYYFGIFPAIFLHLLLSICMHEGRHGNPRQIEEDDNEQLVFKRCTRSSIRSARK